MDAQLSLIMANMAQVDNGHVVVDPFVGSGKLIPFNLDQLTYYILINPCF